MSFDHVLPRNEFIKGDARHSWYEGGVTTDWLQARCVEMRVSPVVPGPVKHQLLLVKQLCVVGFFYWELYSVAIHYATVACEVALRHRLAESLPVPVTLFPRSKKGTKPWVLDQRPEPDALVGYLRGKWRLEGFDEDFRAGFRQLVDWGLKRGIIPAADSHPWEAAVELRNDYAHGSTSIVPMNIPLTILQRTIWMINSLHPDADTDAYDAPRREAAERWITEMNEAIHGEDEREK